MPPRASTGWQTAGYGSDQYWWKPLPGGWYAYIDKHYFRGETKPYHWKLVERFGVIEFTRHRGRSNSWHNAARSAEKAIRSVF